MQLKSLVALFSLMALAPLSQAQRRSADERPAPLQRAPEPAPAQVSCELSGKKELTRDTIIDCKGKRLKVECGSEVITNGFRFGIKSAGFETTCSNSTAGWRVRSFPPGQRPKPIEEKPAAGNQGKGLDPNREANPRGDRGSNGDAYGDWSIPKPGGRGENATIKGVNGQKPKPIEFYFTECPVGTVQVSNRGGNGGTGQQGGPGGQGGSGGQGRMGDWNQQNVCTRNAGWGGLPAEGGPGGDGAEGGDAGEGGDFALVAPANCEEFYLQLQLVAGYVGAGGPPGGAGPIGIPGSGGPDAYERNPATGRPACSGDAGPRTADKRPDYQQVLDKQAKVDPGQPGNKGKEKGPGRFFLNGSEANAADFPLTVHPDEFLKRR